jgi:uncharacterized membrane protein YdjX (TVP38/TMEM64 family)
MARYGVLVAGLVVMLLASLALVEALEVGLLTDAGERLEGDDALGVAALGCTLLVGDVLVPVPSSVVMLALGAELGPLAATVVATAGLSLAGVCGYGIGHLARPWAERTVPRPAWAQADRWLARWGAAAIVASRPVPVLAETVTILAGASRLPFREVALAVVTGSAFVAAVYAVVGAAVVAGDAGLAALLACAVLALVLVGRRALERPGIVLDSSNEPRPARRAHEE